MISFLINNLQQDISLIQKFIENDQKSGFQSINRLLESLSIQLFKIIYDYDLTNLNEIKSNYPSIDLADEKRGVAIQVTSKAEAKKNEPPRPEGRGI